MLIKKNNILIDRVPAQSIKSLTEVVRPYQIGAYNVIIEMNGVTETDYFNVMMDYSIICIILFILLIIIAMIYYHKKKKKKSYI